MKLFVAVLILLVLITGSSLWLYYHSMAIYQDLQDTLSSLDDAVRAEEWDTANTIMEDIDNIWRKGEWLWTSFVDHRQVDRLDESITMLKSLTKTENKDDTTVEISITKRLLERLKETESPLFKSIF